MPCQAGKMVVPNLSVGHQGLGTTIFSGIFFVKTEKMQKMRPVAGSPQRLGDVIENQLTWRSKNWCLEASSSNMDFSGVLALSLPPLRILHHLRVERQCQRNLEIQPGINQRNQPDVCPSRAVAFQCPETSNRHKWRVISGVC